MSKIAEQKALEAYPVNEFFNNESGMLEDANRELRIGYEEGYEQAMKDFMEKAEMWLEPTFKNLAGYNCGDLINDFKNYMQDESENSSNNLKTQSV